jgi:hypothetical protein
MNSTVDYKNKQKMKDTRYGKDLLSTDIYSWVRMKMSNPIRKNLILQLLSLNGRPYQKNYGYFGIKDSIQHQQGINFVL